MTGNGKHILIYLTGPLKEVMAKLKILVEAEKIVEEIRKEVREDGQVSREASA